MHQLLGNVKLPHATISKLRSPRPLSQLFEYLEAFSYEGHDGVQDELANGSRRSSSLLPLHLVCNQFYPLHT